MWQIIGTYQGKTEVLDAYNTMSEAIKMLAEYRLAYGNSWTIDIKKNTKRG